MKVLFFIFLCVSQVIYPFSYDSAIYKAQKGNWQDAHIALNNIVTHNPDRADAVYDAGVAAYNLGNRCQAATCFARAAECSSDKNIAFCAHFNAGNVYVDEKKLEQALEAYDKALTIEPDNEYARHNRDRVAHMLQEQDKQKENQQDQQKKADEQNQDKQDNKDQCGCDKQNQNQQGKENQDGQNQGQDAANKQQGGEQDNKQSGNQSSSDKASADKQDQKGDSSKNESLDQQSQGDGEQGERADSSKNAQRKEHGNDKENHQNSANNEKRDGKNEFDKQSKNAQRQGNEQQGGKHDTTPEKQHGSNDKNNVSAQGGQEQADEGNKLDEIGIDDPWLLNVLNNQEVHDKAVNKQLMEAKIRQHGGKNAQNCW